MVLFADSTSADLLSFSIPLSFSLVLSPWFARKFTSIHTHWLTDLLSIRMQIRTQSYIFTCIHLILCPSCDTRDIRHPNTLLLNMCLCRVSDAMP